MRHGSGAGYPRAPCVLELPDGSERFECLDEESRWRADDIPAGGSCRIRFDPPLRLAPVQQRDKPRELTGSAGTSIELRRAGAVPTCVRTAERHVLVVPKTAAHAVRVGDIHFGTSRAVVMPALPEGFPRGGATPLDTIAAALAHAAAADPRPFTLVAGHTDTVGSASTNDDLSHARAVNVDLLLRDDGPGWAAHAQAHHTAADLQRVLQSAAVRQGWPCDPGSIDGDLGPATRAARRAFREGYNQEMASPMASSDPRGQALLRRSRWCLLATVVGSVLGLGLAFGPLGWWWGRRLCQDHEKLGHPPPWMAAAAWTAGRAITVTMLVCLIALVTR